MTTTIQETFLELDWGDEEQARQARAARAAQLQEEGYMCTYQNLYTVYGYRVFLLEATKLESIEEPSSIPQSSSSKTKDRPVLRSRRNHLPSFEER
ncbi:hypothetical protein HJG54_31010 [Leptolyngbya sp. NK1-12]|uniref:Uncharacterized protein n=1 Tax=Leptolyngbya sp. NK1-12 TaxID=2547451 RepID=A0AA96WLF4_9CYAN|nr:hypothetical protein [Leptolyngbya sp. NK1-12]MBF2047949.1 hypothetical protein [Elainella sp. C42_A2020_010]RNJ65356.1 MAG: hypothetical protein EDM05_31735 [Leptolyngbya sp. IPPAS B-1204]WNZ27319.1 hypothetical protein HJG54_31010 [Leptolyngbya sp. NK1-12]